MGTENKIYKILLYISNLILLIGAIAMVITMVAMMVKGKEYIDLMGNNSSWIIACTVVGLAIIMVFISSVGILGTFGKNTCLMKMYIIITSILMIILVVSGVLAYVYKKEALATVRENMKNKMSSYRPGTTDDETRVWDVIQQELQCCGIDSHRDWSEYHTSYKGANRQYPDSCKSNADQGIHHVFVDGCMLKTDEFIRLRHWSIGGAIAGFFIYLCLSILIACMVLKNIANEDPLIFEMNEKGYDNTGMQIKA